MLAALPPGARLGIERVAPHRARGWCGNLDVPHGAGLDYIMEGIRAEWGGGTFRLRPLDLNGKFVRGAVSASIVGEPLHQGRPIGYEMPAGAAWPNVQPYPPTYAGTPARPFPFAADDPRVVASLSTLVGTLVGAKADDRDRLMREGLQNLATQVAAQQTAAPRTDALGDVDRVIGLVGKLREVGKALAPEREDEGGGGGGPFGGMSMPKNPQDMLMLFLMHKMMGGDQPNPHAQGRWSLGSDGQAVWTVPVFDQQRNQWTFAPAPPPMPMGGGPMMGGNPMAAMMGGAPPFGGMMPPQQPPPQQQQPPQQHPQQSTPPAPPYVHTDDEDSGPITADDVLDELQNMRPEEAAALFDEVGRKLPPEIQHAIYMRYQQQQPQQQPQQQQPQQEWPNVVTLPTDGGPKQ